MSSSQLRGMTSARAGWWLMICPYHMIDMQCNTCIIRRFGLVSAPYQRRKSMKWVTRERPKIDRIACPWLIARFIDEKAEFLYVPAAEVMTFARRMGATPFDVPDVEYGHHGEKCSFDAFVERHHLADPALQRLAVIVRGADTGRPDLTPQSPGLLAISQGLSAVFADDHEMLRHGMVVYDALYAWCRAQVDKAA